MTKSKRFTALLLSASLVLSGNSMNLMAANSTSELTDITLQQQAAAPTAVAADMDSTENRDTTDMRVKELVKERTENSTVYKLNNGSTEEVFYGGEVRFQDEDGKLKDYDPSLTKLPKEAVSENGKELNGYQFANKEGDKKHYIPSELSEETPILMEHNKYEITFHPVTGQSAIPAIVEKGEEEPKAEPAAPADLTADIQEDGTLMTKEEADEQGKADGPEEADEQKKADEQEVTRLAAKPSMQADINAVQLEKEKTINIYDKEVELPTKAVYDIPDADMAMEYSSLPEGLKENIVLQKKPESNIFTYQMKLTGLIPLLEEESGQILFLDKENGELEAYISNPYMNDATGEAYSEEVAYQLLEKEGEEDVYLLNLIASEEYLNAVERQYPVTIDPTVTWVGSSKIGDTYVINGSSYTGTNFSGNAVKTICAGKGKQGVFRTFMSFIGLTPSIKGKYVDSAKLTLYETAKSVKGQKIQAHRVTKAWSPTSITWKNQATYTATPLSAVTSKGSAAAANTFNLTSFARNIANGSAVNYGIMLRGSNESTTKFVQYSSTRDSANAARRPKLSVVYYDGPTSASSVKLKSAYVKKGSNITLSWAGINSKSLNRVEYRVAKYNDSTKKDTEYIAYSGSTKIGTTASGTKTITASAKWPAGCYRIYVRGVDNGGIKAVGIGVTLHIDSTAPALSSASLTPATSTTAYSSNSRPVIKWSGASDAHFNRVEYSINGGAYASAGTAASGSLTLPAGKLTKPGTYVFRVRSADKAANYSAVKTINYYFDNQAPTGKIAITDGVGEHDGQIEIALTASDVGSGIKQNLLQMLNSQGEVVSTLYNGTSGKQTIYLNPDDIAEADYTLKQTVKDKAGNTYAGKPQAIKIIPISAWQPKNVTAQDKINYKTYIKWDRKSEDELPANISYEIYRGTESGFTADESTLAASGIKTNYWCEPNVRYGEKFYYKVRAVRTAADGKVIKESPFSAEVSSRVTAADEYEKRLGEQDYWDYTEFSTPNGNGSIEHSKGNFTYSQQDASLPSAELSFDIVRNYNSQSTVKTAFGLGWDHSLNLELLRLCDPESGEENGYVFKDGSGTIFQFKKQEDGSYAIPGSKEYRLTELLQDEMVTVGGEAKEEESETSDNEQQTGRFTRQHTGEEQPPIAYRFLMKDKENQSYYFNSGGQLVYVTEPNGTWQTFAYDENQGLLTKIANNAGRELTFTYQDGEGEDHLLVKAITLPDKSSIQYTYEDEHLKKVTRKAGDSDASVSYAYEYTKDGKVGTVLDAENNAYTIGYVSEKADSVTYPNGDKLTLSYQDGKTVVKKLAAGGGELYTESVEYDKESGNPVKKTDALGNVTSYIYKDNLLTESSRMVDYQELVNGVVESRKKLLTTKSVYDENGNPVKETGEDGSQTTYEYGAAEEVNINNPTEIIETAGDGKLTSDTTYTYDDKGNELSSEDSVSDSSVNTVYQTGSGDEISRTEKETNELKGNVTSTSETTYDEDGNEVSETSTTGDITETSANEYDVMGRQIKSVDSDGTITTNTYDFLGYLVKIETDYNGIVETSTTSYSLNGQVKEEVAADGTVTSYTYDNMNRLIAKTVSKDGKTDKFFTSYEYGSVTTFTGTDGNTNTVNLASIEKTTNANGDVTAISYQNGKGQIVREKANGIYVDYIYDSEGRAIATYSIGTREDDPSKGKLSVVVYDENGNQTANLLNPVSTETGYKVGADTIVTTQTFDVKGNVLTSTDGEGNVTRYEYDETSRVSKVRLDDKDGENVTSYTYDKTDSDGNITSTTINALGKISETTEDASGRVKSIVDQGDGNNAITTNNQYDENGNQSKTIYSNGDYKTYTYDSKNRLTELHYFRADGTETLSTEYEYDKSDQTTAMKDYKVEDGEEIPVRYSGYQYDGLGNLTGFYEVNDTNKPSAEEIAEAKITCTYDINNNLTSLSYPENSGEVEKLLYHYNADNWLTSISAIRNDGTESKLREYSYHTDGKVAAMKDYREFASGGSEYILKAYDYDAFDRVTRMAYTDSSDPNKVMESYEYTYDKNNNILTEKAWNLYPEKEEDRVNETKSYTYDSLGRLKKSVVEKADGTKKTVNYSYDKMGNRLAMEEEGVERTTYSYNGLNQLITSTTAKTSGSEDKVSEKAYQYNSNGNEIRETDSVTGEVRENTYDVDNRLSQAVIKKGDTVSVTQQNEYNGEGQRIRKIENEKVTEYFYQDDSVLYTGDGAGEKTIVNYLGLENNIIAAHKNTGEADPAYYLYNKDLQGSTTGLVDAQGKNALSYQYGDFGSTKVFGNAEVENEICYAGGIYDAVIGEYYLNARYYDPGNGCFTSQDTNRGEVEDYSTWNLYSYCFGNPINYIDPTGHRRKSYVIYDAAAKAGDQKHYFRDEANIVAGQLKAKT